MRLGEVQSDGQAFQQILGRLESDVGTILQLIPEGRKKGLFPNTAPYWALVRMTFPIAESVGDLIYRNDNTTENLKSVLETEFEAVRPGYQGKAAILTLLFRHSLIHTDELRSLFIRGKEIQWLLSWSARENHLQLVRVAAGVCSIHFDTTAFYDDLVDVCHKAMGKQWGGQVMKRYNEWLTLDLDKTNHTKIVTAAISEIGEL
jgi:hypothetical protein